MTGRQLTGRRAFLGCVFGLPLALSGCGWAPLYADPATGPADAELRAIRVAPIPERIGQRLAIALRDSLNPGGNPAGEPTPQRYILRTILQTARLDLGVITQGVGTRGRFEVRAAYSLSDIRSGAQLLSGSSHVAESFDILANQYSNVVAEDDARTRAAEELRRDILTQLTVALQRRVAEAAAR